MTIILVGNKCDLEDRYNPILFQKKIFSSGEKLAMKKQGLSQSQKEFRLLKPVQKMESIPMLLFRPQLKPSMTK